MYNYVFFYIFRNMKILKFKILFLKFLKHHFLIIINYKKNKGKKRLNVNIYKSIACKY